MMGWSRGENPYEILGVADHASLAGIESAHRDLMVICANDMAQDESLSSQARTRFCKVLRTHKLLSDDRDREIYDLPTNRAAKSKFKEPVCENTEEYSSPDEEYFSPDEGYFSPDDAYLSLDEQHLSPDESTIVSRQKKLREVLAELEKDPDESTIARRQEKPRERRGRLAELKQSLEARRNEFAVRSKLSEPDWMDVYDADSDPTTSGDHSPVSPFHADTRTQCQPFDPQKRRHSASSTTRRSDLSRRQSIGSVSSRASSGSRASQSSQVSDGSVNEAKSLFHAIDDLISEHLRGPIFAVGGKKFFSRKKTNPALEHYKNAVIEFLWAIHYHYDYLRKVQAEDWDVINTSHDKLIVLYDDLKLAIKEIGPVANLRTISDRVYNEHHERYIQFRERLITICGIPVPVPRVGTMKKTNPDRSINGKGPFSSILTEDKVWRTLKKKEKHWKPQKPKSRLRVQLLDSTN